MQQATQAKAPLQAMQIHHKMNLIFPLIQATPQRIIISVLQVVYKVQKVSVTVQAIVQQTEQIKIMHKAERIRLCNL